MKAGHFKSDFSGEVFHVEFSMRDSKRSALHVVGLAGSQNSTKIRS